MNRVLHSGLTSSRVDTEALRRSHPVADVVARYGVELKRQGRALVGRCMFHADGGRPNLHVYADSWRCYRCGIGGDVLAFVMQAENVGFREAVDLLTDGQHAPTRPKAHATRSRSPHSAGGLDGRTSEELAVLHAATTLYHHSLFAEPRAVAYLEGRGIDPQTIRQHRLGYAAGDQLLSYLRWRRLSVEAALRTGVLTRGGQEFLAGRLVVPELRAGRPVWLIGRILAAADEAEPKYLGLPGSKPLLGWEQARAEPAVCLVEGAFDYLTLRMWEVPAIALLGTHPRPDLLANLRTLPRVYLALDSDEAGREATLRLQEAIGPSAVRVALPEGIHDVAELAPRPDGRALFTHALLEAASATSA
jgi:DNA primase